MFSPASPSFLPGGRLENNSYVTAREYDKYTPAVGQGYTRGENTMEINLKIMKKPEPAQIGIRVNTRVKAGGRMDPQMHV
jgi:hypothetical protein